MRLHVLVDDKALADFPAEHGLSVYSELGDGNVLFDTGNTGLFIENAKRLGLDIGAIDVAVISHGHDDHGGGISAFLEANDHAPVYVSSHAFEPHFTKRKSGEIQYNGLDETLKSSPRVVRVSDRLDIGDDLTVFSHVPGFRLPSLSNNKLLVPEGDSYRQDPFLHEQSLIVRKEGKSVLLAGCSHRGIVNIMDAGIEINGGPFDAVIGGFHLSNPRDGGSEPRETIEAIAEYFLSFPTEYWTCHCTGTTAFEMLQDSMGDRIHYAAAGTTIDL
jgi:7,8-dihydropterin-6-yl-methyl-4-(beta-D-ribofuranosyl)aminobenzene 5'-phosphate synthase